MKSGVSLLRQDLYEAIHAGLEVRHDSADNQICSGVLKLDYFHPIENVREERSGIQSSINSPIRIVDQRWQLRRAGKSSDLVGKAHVAGLRPVVINNDLVQTRNDEVDCAASLDLWDLRNHHMRVEGRRRG